MPEGQQLALSADNREAADSAVGDSAVGACRQRVHSSKRACNVRLLEQQGQPRWRARPASAGVVCVCQASCQAA
jgi:hypothetical protein